MAIIGESAVALGQDATIATDRMLGTADNAVSLAKSLKRDEIQ